MTYKVTESATEVKFLEKYYYPILDSVKTQTMRVARKRLDVREGDIVTAVFKGKEETCKLKILKIGYKQMKSIDLDDAIREGYNTLSEFKNDLLKIYPTLFRFDRLYYYQFEVIK